MNRIWEEITASDGIYYKLKFDKFKTNIYETILFFSKHKTDENIYVYVSPFLNVEFDEITAESIDDAKEQFEEMVIDYLENEILFCENLLNNFKED